MNQKDVSQKTRDERSEVHRNVENRESKPSRVRRGAPLDADGQHWDTKRASDGGGHEEAEQSHPFGAGESERGAGRARRGRRKEKAPSHSDSINHCSS